MKNTMLKRKHLFLSSILLIFCPPVFSEGLILDLTGGISHTENNSYKEGASFESAFGYAWDAVHLKAGTGYLGNFELEHGEDNTDIEVKGGFIQVALPFDLNVVSLEIGAGIYATWADARYEGIKVGDNQELNPFVDLRVVKNLNDLISLQGGIKHIDDVSGSNLFITNFGIRFSF